MATGMNPSVEVGAAPDHPPPVTNYGEKWVLRTYQAQKTSSSATGGVTFSANDFGLSANNTFYVDKVQVWRLTNTADSSGLFASFYQQNLTDLGGDALVARDYGTATSLAGMTFKVPLGHAKDVSVGSTSLVDCNPAYGTAQGQTFCAHLHCWVSY